MGPQSSVTSSAEDSFATLIHRNQDLLATAAELQLDAREMISKAMASQQRARSMRRRARITSDWARAMASAHNRPAAA
jgi:hypothetical protein